MPDKKNNGLINTQFDQYSRQTIAHDLIKNVRKDKVLKILDIGGHLGRTTEFFANDDVTVIDVYEEIYDNYVKGNALDLPFRDNSFDVVTSFDVFEHIPEGDRDLFVDEACRVSKDIVLIAAPFDTDLVAITEKSTNELYRSVFNKDHPWLIEHIENGLPQIAKTEKRLKYNKLNYNIYSSNNIFLWKIMMSFLFYCGDSRLNKLGDAVNRFYNQHAYKLGDHTDPSYRKIFFARKNNKNTKTNFASSSLNDEVYMEFLETIFKGISSLVKDKKKSIEEAEAHQEKEVVLGYEERLKYLSGQLTYKNEHPYRNLGSHLRRKIKGGR